MENLINFLNNKYKGPSQIKTFNLFYYNEINKSNVEFGKISWGQKLYNYLNEIKLKPQCVCGNTLKFHKFSVGYKKYCSNNCRYSDVKLKNKRKESLLKKYGVDNPMKSTNIQLKRKKNMLHKYGVEHHSKLKTIIEKKKKTCLEKYGVNTNLLSLDHIEKTKKSNLIKYGVEHHSKSNIVKDNIKNNNLKKYGVEHTFQVDEFKSKSKTTNQKKYGVNHSSLSSTIRKKQEATKKNKKRIEISKIIGINENLIDVGFNGEWIINNYCQYHNKFSITTNLLHQRWYKYDKKICTKCYPISKQISVSEMEMSDFIKSLNLNVFIKNREVLNNKFELDVYLPTHKIAVEFNGLYWHSDLFKDRNYHLNKTLLCEEQGIQLFHVFENEWVIKKDIVKSIIKSKLGLFENRIYARKTEIREITNNKLVREFLNNNHLQGFVGSKIKLGLFYNNELVSLMTFGKKRIAMGSKSSGDGEYEMLRFSNKLNTQIIGGASKLLKYFIKTYQPKSITSFADRRYSNGELYKTLGFKHISNTQPNYWYFKKNNYILQHRFGFRKDVLVKEGFDAQKTEHQIMDERGYMRIYDCGNMKFKLYV